MMKRGQEQQAEGLFMRSRRGMWRGRGGQSTLEYAVFVATVSAAVITMSLYVRRAMQANFKALENEINAEVELR